MDTGVEEVVVFDRTDALRPNLGGGIQVNGGAAVLARLGLGEEILKAGLPVKSVRTRTAQGFELLNIDVQQAVGREPSLLYKGTPMCFTIMRDSLQKLLADSLREGTIQTNKKLVGLTDDEASGGVRLAFDDGTEDVVDMVIGADGIRSAVKKETFPGPGRDPVYANIRIQFGVADGWERAPEYSQELHQWFSEGTYALSGQYLGLEGKPFEMFALVFADDNASEDAENSNWEANEVKQDCLRRLSTSGQPKEVVDLCQRCERFYEIGVFYYPSLNPWTSPSGKRVLIGDAAHAMPPFLGQGANQAIQDAFCLAEKLSELKSGDIATVKDALKAYERQRKLPTSAIQLESRFLGILETAGGGSGTLPSFVRDSFFFMTGKLGVAEKVFVTGATPTV